jgi:hypothetical protein
MYAISGVIYTMPIPVAAQSKAWVSGRSLAGIVGSNTAGSWMYVSCECCVLSSTDHCDGPIQKSSIESVYECIVECDPYSILYTIQHFLRRLTGSLLVTKFPICETRRLINAFTKIPPLVPILSQINGCDRMQQ